MDPSSDFVPSEPIPVVRLNPETRERELVHLQGIDPEFYDAEELERMMRPWPSDRMLQDAGSSLTQDRPFW
jgi:hypothetical protein